MWVQPSEHKVVGEVFAEARRRANLTQDELAIRLGKPQSFVSAYENGQRRIDILECLRIANALGTECEIIFFEILKRFS